MIQSIKASMPRIMVLIRALFVVMWLGTLAGTDALFSVYSLCAVVCMYCMFDNVSNKRKRPEHGMLSISLVCAIFSLLVFLANYTQFTVVWYMDSLYYPTNILKNGLNAVNCLIGGFCVAYEIVVYALSQYPKQISDPQSRIHSGRMFWFVFASVLLVDLVYLFFDEYPGQLTPDALYQIQQGYTNQFVNDHPFWNTLYIELVMNAGYMLFGSPNGGLALYSIIQIFMAAGCFAYACMTLYQTGIPKWMLGAAFFVYVLLPYNIVYSTYMGKDVIFSYAVLTMTVSLFRLIRKIGKGHKWDYTLLALSAAAVCMSRTNGLPLLAIFAVLMLRYFWKADRKVLIIFVVVLLVAGILCGPVLTLLEISSADVSEAFSLPLQQLARVVCDGSSLTDEQQILLGKIFDLENLSEIYTPWLADPIKVQVRTNDSVYFSEHLADYAKLWFELGLKYPLTYLKAWIEQTKGYWNGGYAYFQYVEMMQENSYGFYKASGSNIVASLIELYFAFTRQAMIFEPVHAIGLHVWLVSLCCFLNWRQKRPEWLLHIPLVLIFLGLWIGTPVYAEFRYAYPLFLTVPFLIPITAYQQTAEE